MFLEGRALNFFIFHNSFKLILTIDLCMQSSRATSGERRLQVPPSLPLCPSDRLNTIRPGQLLTQKRTVLVMQCKRWVRDQVAGSGK